MTQDLECFDQAATVLPTASAARRHMRADCIVDHHGGGTHTSLQDALDAIPFTTVNNDFGGDDSGNPDNYRRIYSIELTPGYQSGPVFLNSEALRRRSVHIFCPSPADHLSQEAFEGVGGSMWGARIVSPDPDDTPAVSIEGDSLAGWNAVSFDGIEIVGDVDATDGGRSVWIDRTYINGRVLGSGLLLRAHRSRIEGGIRTTNLDIEAWDTPIPGGIIVENTCAHGRFHQSPFSAMWIKQTAIDIDVDGGNVADANNPSNVTHDPTITAADPEVNDDPVSAWMRLGGPAGVTILDVRVRGVNVVLNNNQADPPLRALVYCEASGTIKNVVVDSVAIDSSFASGDAGYMPLYIADGSAIGDVCAAQHVLFKGNSSPKVGGFGSFQDSTFGPNIPDDVDYSQLPLDQGGVTIWKKSSADILTIIQEANQSTGGAAFVPATEMRFEVLQGRVYTFRMMLIFQTSNTSDTMAIRFDVPSGCAIVWGTPVGENEEADSETVSNTLASFASFATIEGWVSTTEGFGEAILEFANPDGPAGAVTLLFGSRLEVWNIEE